LVDKETAIDDIVDEYTRNGTRLIEDLERKASADRRELESQFSNTLKQVTRSFQQTRDVTIALDAEWENLDDLEAQWRKRQHELQDFMNEKIKCVANGSWKDLIKN
jgi:transposase